jgi:hypothetical protein
MQLRFLPVVAVFTALHSSNLPNFSSIGLVLGLFELLD